MTERKPAGMSFGSWIDQQINEAVERGAFDDLPGAGKPLPRRDETDAGQAWLRDYLRREGVPTEELLPAPLRLRKEAERLADGAPSMRSEQEVREAVTALNQRIRDWRRSPLDSPIFVPLVDEEAMVSRWRQAQLTAPASSSRSGSDHRHPGAADPPPGRWRRLISLRRRRANGAQ
jgi:hypothetical protein